MKNNRTFVTSRPLKPFAIYDITFDLLFLGRCIVLTMTCRQNIRYMNMYIVPSDACVQVPKQFIFIGSALLRISKVNGNDRNVARVHNLTNSTHSIMANIIVVSREISYGTVNRKNSVVRFTTLVLPIRLCTRLFSRLLLLVALNDNREEVFRTRNRAVELNVCRNNFVPRIVRNISVIPNNAFVITPMFNLWLDLTCAEPCVNLKANIIVRIIEANGPIVMLRMPMVNRQSVGPYALGFRDSTLAVTELVLLFLTTPSTVMTKLLTLGLLTF